jgi:hypothetical protein
MNLKSRRRLEVLKRILQFAVDHPQILSNAVAAAAFAAVAAAIEETERLASKRLHDTRTYRSAAAERQSSRAELHELLSNLSRVSKTLDRALYPDIAAQLKMGRLNSAADLLALARNAIRVVTPLKQVFVDRGAPETVLEDIQSLIDQHEAAARRRNAGRGAQISRNVDLRLAARRGMDHLRILDGILHLQFKRNSGVIAEWNAAKRLRRTSAKPLVAVTIANESPIVPDSVAPVTKSTAFPSDSKWDGARTHSNRFGFQSFFAGPPFACGSTNPFRSVASSSTAAAVTLNSTNV